MKNVSKRYWLARFVPMFIASFRIQPFKRWFSNEDAVAGFSSGTFQAQAQAWGTILKIGCSIALFFAKTLDDVFSKTVYRNQFLSIQNVSIVGLNLLK